MTGLEELFFWLAVAGYVLTGLLNLASLTVLKNKKLLLISGKIGLVSFAVHLAALVTRTVVTGHFPVKGGYENALAGAAFVIGFYFALQRFFPAVEVVGSGIFFIILLVMGSSLTNIPPLEPLTPPYKSIWLWIHVLFAWLAYSSYTMAAALSVVYLIRERRQLKLKIPFELPSQEKIDEIWFRFVVFGFITNAIMISSGSIWAHYLWGSYWKWDPVETWSLITWLLFGLYLHLRLTLGCWLERQKTGLVYLAWSGGYQCLFLGSSAYSPDLSSFSQALKDLKELLAIDALWLVRISIALGGYFSLKEIL